MSEISIIEFLVLAIPTYGTFFFIISSSMGSAPLALDKASTRVMVVAPAAVFSLALVVMSPQIVMLDEVSTITSTNSSEVITDTTVYSIELENMSWGAIHMTLFAIFFFYIMLNLHSLLTKKPKNN
ncbi:MAG: hypothetical protein IS860_10840 [Nitrosopumilus sp.]|nr:hypothetical protein [Nitrosopumilus sp.]